jgi:hypothetical protein
LSNDPTEDDLPHVSVSVSGEDMMRGYLLSGSNFVSYSRRS